MKDKIVIVLRVLTALIFLQTLYFKFTASPESVYIFSKLGMEPYGRIVSGIAELVAAILLLLPATFIFGAFISILIILGAILSHLTLLGIVVKDDSGLLFILAISIFIFSTLILFLKKEGVVQVLKQLGLKKGV
ncbi:MAG: DoxX family protein [Leptospiraceae bacterium]|jgi:putative oxidoreductase|nr:DoxX family protein [Leptospiraceae bacterium]